MESTRIKHGPFEFDLLPEEEEEGLRTGTMPGYTPQFVLGSDPEKGMHGRLGEKYFHGLTLPEMVGLLTKSPGEFPTIYKNPWGLMGAVSRLKSPLMTEEIKTAAFKNALIQAGVRRPVVQSHLPTLVDPAPRGVTTQSVRTPEAYAKTQAVQRPSIEAVQAPVSRTKATVAGRLSPQQTPPITVPQTPIQGVGQQSASAQLRAQLQNPAMREQAQRTVEQGAQQFRQVAQAGPIGSRARALFQYGANPFQSKEKMLRGIVQKRPELEVGVTQGVQQSMMHPQGMDAGMRAALDRYGFSTKHIQSPLGAVPELMEETHLRTGIPHREFIGQSPD